MATIPLNSVSIQAVLTGEGLERYTVAPPFSQTLTAQQIATGMLGNVSLLRSNPYGIYVKARYAAPNDLAAPDSARTSLVLIHLPGETVWVSEYDNEEFLVSTSPYHPVGVTVTRELDYYSSPSQGTITPLPSSTTLGSQAFFRSLRACVSVDSVEPAGESYGAVKGLFLAPLFYLQLMHNPVVSSGSPNTWKSYKYSSVTQTWQEVNPVEIWCAVMLRVANGQIDIFLANLSAGLTNEDLGEPFYSQGWQASFAQVENDTLRMSTSLSTAAMLGKIVGKVFTPPANNLMDIEIENFLLRSSAFESPSAGEYKNKIIRNSALGITLNGETQWIDLSSVIFKTSAGENLKGWGIRKMYAAVQNVVSLLPNAPTGAKAWTVARLHPAVTWLTPAFHWMDTIPVWIFPIPTGYTAPTEQVSYAKAEIHGYLRPCRYTDNAGKDVTLTVPASQIQQDSLLTENLWVKANVPYPSLVIEQVHVSMPRLVSSVRTFETIDLTPYVQYADVREYHSPATLTTSPSAVIAIDAIDDGYVTGVTNKLLNATGATSLHLTIRSNMGGIQDIKPSLSLWEAILPAGMDKEYRIQGSNRTLVIQATGWFEFVQNVPVLFPLSFDGWCWRSAVRFLWERAGLPREMLWLDPDTNPLSPVECDDGPYPMIKNTSTPCPHYKLATGTIGNPRWMFHPQTSCVQAILSITNLLRRQWVYAWYEDVSGKHLFLRTIPFVSLMNSLLNSPAEVVIETGTHFPDVNNLSFATTTGGTPIIETSQMVMTSNLWDIRTKLVVSGQTPTGYPVISSRDLGTVWTGQSSYNWTLENPSSPFFVGVPRPELITHPVFVNPDVAKTYLDNMDIRNVPTIGFYTQLPTVFLNIFSRANVVRIPSLDPTFFRACYVASYEHYLRRGSACVSAYRLKIVENP